MGAADRPVIDLPADYRDGRAALVANKTAVGREQDIADVAALTR